MMNIAMKLQVGPFEAIKSGKKDIELRLYDEKRQKLQLGDVITFSKLPDQKETVVAEIVGLLRYPTFADLAEDFAPERMGGADKTSIVQGMHKYYSPEDQARFGVVGIKLKLR
jgi:ASC-1-like (ASCH) protein